MAILCICITHLLILQQLRRGIAQLVEHRSPKPRVVSSNLTAPATKKRSPLRWLFLLAIEEVDENSWGKYVRLLAKGIKSVMAIANERKF